MALCLVTGIAGFIGSALAHALLEGGERVRGIDNFSTGKAANIADIRSRIELIEADLNDAAASAEACRGADYVLHQAAWSWPAPAVAVRVGLRIPSTSSLTSRSRTTCAVSSN